MCGTEKTHIFTSHETITKTNYVLGTMPQKKFSTPQNQNHRTYSLTTMQ